MIQNTKLSQRWQASSPVIQGTTYDWDYIHRKQTNNKKSNFYFVFTINNILLSHFEPSLWNLATQVFPFKKWLKKHVSASLGLTHTVIYRKLFINLYCRSLLKPYLITFYSNIAQPHLTFASTKPKAVFYEYTTEVRGMLRALVSPIFKKGKWSPY